MFFLKLQFVEPQLTGQITRARASFCINTPSASVWFWIPWLSACDVFLPHSHNANQIFVWPFCPPGFPQASKNIESLTFVLLGEINKPLMLYLLFINSKEPFTGCYVAAASQTYDWTQWKDFNWETAFLTYIVIDEQIL